MESSSLEKSGSSALLGVQQPNYANSKTSTSFNIESSKIDKSKSYYMALNGQAYGNSMSKAERALQRKERLIQSRTHPKEPYKCQVDRNCQKQAIDFCSVKPYRGCTLAYCEDHSGELHRLEQQATCLKLCAKDRHEDICSVCSGELLQSKRRFYRVAVLMSVIIFSILLVLVHLLL